MLAVWAVTELSLFGSRPAPQEAFGGLGRAMDRELDDLVPVLLKKAGEVR